MPGEVREGQCHICGTIGPLTFEHVPPRSAFNKQPLVAVALKDALKFRLGDVPVGPVEQGGFGRYTLCPTCNNNTGSWYGPQFVSWAQHGLEVLGRLDGPPLLCYPVVCEPLAILKQIVTMFFSVNGPDMAGRHPALVKFVLDKKAQGLPPEYRYYVSYNGSPVIRMIGLSARLMVGTGEVVMISEISFPPFSYVFSQGPVPPDPRQMDISGFARYQWRERRTLFLKIPYLPVVGAMPADFRSMKEIENDARQNREDARRWEAERRGSRVSPADSA